MRKESITVLVTGANRGLGLGFAQHYLENGDRVIATARQPETAAALQRLADRKRAQMRVERLDVSDPGSIQALADRLADTTLDLVINNAGVANQQNFGEWTEENMADVFRVNTFGPALVAQALAPRMGLGGRLVQLSSGLGSISLNINPEDGMDAYAASKAALNMLCRRLSAKMQPRGIVVIAISPGWVRTDMGGADADLSVKESIASMAQAIEHLAPHHSGGFIDRKGDPLSW
jgi:NAD(P)-dependent dehydrogenase (short-subunit alcohol dehydrogenase family)